MGNVGNRSAAPPGEGAEARSSVALLPVRIDVLLIIVIGLGCLLPFIGKALHIDDPIFVWMAQHIQTAPLDPYGFEFNWHGQVEPVFVFNQNPPGAPYYLALAGWLMGWSEIALHAAMTVPLLALLMGTYRLAMRWQADPRAAALVLLAMPAVLVSATTLMVDVLMLALWCWAFILWTEALEERRGGMLLAAGLLAALCALTKYSGLLLIPLMALYALGRERRWWGWLPGLILAIALVAAFNAYMSFRYGVFPLTGAGGYALSYRPAELRWLESGIVGLSFLGGGLLVGLFYMPLLWSRVGLTIWLLVLTLVAAALSWFDSIGGLVLRDAAGAHWLAVVQLAVFVTCGAQWLSLAAADLWRRRDLMSLVLVLWLVGVLVFAAFLNWSINARSVLPAAPAAALLLARRLRHNREVCEPRARLLSLAPLVAGLMVAFLVASADYVLAESARRAGVELVQKHQPADGTLWYQGAWGFHYYAKSAGAQRIDQTDVRLLPGDVVIQPANNTSVNPIPSNWVTLLEHREIPVMPWVATMAQSVGAGFYTNLWGPLPFAFGAAPAETYDVLRMERSFRVPAQLE